MFSRLFNTIFPRSRVTGRRPFLAASLLFGAYMAATLPVNRTGGEATGADIAQSTLVSDQLADDSTNEQFSKNN